MVCAEMIFRTRANRLEDCEDDVREGLGNVGDASLPPCPKGAGLRGEAGQDVRFRKNRSGAGDEEEKIQHVRMAYEG